MPPPAQRPATQRAAQLPARQLPLDHCPVTVYREHDASKRQPRGPPRGLRQKDNGEGRAKSDAPTVPARAPGCNPATHRPVGKAPPPTQSRSAARPLHPHRHPRPRSPPPAIRILSAVEQPVAAPAEPSSEPVEGAADRGVGGAVVVAGAEEARRPRRDAEAVAPGGVGA